jgi:hypothetical protein
LSQEISSLKEQTKQEIVHTNSKFDRMNESVNALIKEIEIKTSDIIAARLEEQGAELDSKLVESCKEVSALK